MIVLGICRNMLFVFFIVFYLDKFFNYVVLSSEGGKKLVDIIVMNIRWKVEFIKEFKWFGFMLFVVVLFFGIGVWMGVFVVFILGMLFWENILVNFVGVLLVGVLVNLVVSVGIWEVFFVGFVFFILFIFMWWILCFFN